MNETAPAPINREAVKVLAQVIGIREAARRMGLDEHRVLKWSQRDPAGPWGSMIAPPAPPSRGPVAKCPQNVLSASEAMAEANADNSRRSRAAALRYSARTLEHAADLDPETALASASDVSSVVKVASVAGGWGDQDKQRVRVSIFAGAGSAVQVVSDKE